jgi:hypothetical protein
MHITQLWLEDEGQEAHTDTEPPLKVYDVD